MSANQTGNTRVTRHQKPTQKRTKSLLGRIIKWGLLALLALIIAGIGLFAYYAKDAPEITQDKLQNGNASVLYDTNNKAFKRLGAANQTYASSDQIPQTLKDAVVSIEDRRFYKEKFGIDPVRIASAAFSNITGHSSLGLQGDRKSVV